MTPTISIRNLTKRYGSFEAVSDLTLEIEAGSICGLLGPNGAGKSTTFKCLLGLARPTSGTVAIEGKPVTPDTFQRLGYVAEVSSLYPWMTLAQHLEQTRRLFTGYDATRARELIERFEIDPRKRLKNLSKGQRTAAALIVAFCVRPAVLVLDEPTSGLDPMRQRDVLDLAIDAAAGGSTVLFSSHQITQVERAADRVAILRRGKLIVDKNVDMLKSSEKVVEAIFDGAVPEVDGLATDPRVRRFDRSGRMLRAYVRSGGFEIAGTLQNLGARSVSVNDVNLEDIFLTAVQADAEKGRAS